MSGWRGEWGLASNELINTVRWYQMCTAFRGEEEQLEQTRNSSYSCQDYSREHRIAAANRIYPALGMKGWLGQAVLAQSQQENVALLKGKTRQQGPLSKGHGPTASRWGGQSRSDGQGQTGVLDPLVQIEVRKEGGKSAQDGWVHSQLQTYLQHSSGTRAWAAPKQTGEALPALPHSAFSWQPFPSLQQCWIMLWSRLEQPDPAGGRRLQILVVHSGVIQLPGHSSCPKQTTEGSGRFWKAPVMTSSSRVWASSVSPWLGCHSSSTWCHIFLSQGETEFFVLGQ